MKAHHSSTDLLRLVASFFVVLLHAAAMEMGSLPPSDANAFFPCLFNALSRFSVPVFVMISGRYLLATPCPVHRGVRKAGQMLRLLLLWGGFYLLYDLLRGWRPSGVADIAAKWLTEPVHLWYFYAAMALYLFAPLLSVFTAHASRKELLYALCLTGLFGSVVTTVLRMGNTPLLAAIVEKTKVPYAMGFLFCFLLGHYLTRYPPQRRTRLFLYTAGTAGVIFTFVATLLLSRRGGSWNELFFSFYAPNVILTAAAVFTAVNHSSIPPKAQPALSFPASASGGVYGLHILVLTLLPAFIPGVLLRALTTYAISCAAVLLFKQGIRLVKR